MTPLGIPSARIKVWKWPRSGACLWEDFKPKASKVHPDDGSFSHELLPTVHALFKKAGWKPQDLDAVAVCLGRLDPGQPAQHRHRAVHLGGADQQGRPLADDAGHRARGDPPALVHHDHVAAGLLDLGEQVAGQEHRRPVVRQAAQEGAELPDARRVHAVGRLIEDENFRIVQKRARELKWNSASSSVSAAKAHTQSAVCGAGCRSLGRYNER